LASDKTMGNVLKDVAGQNYWNDFRKPFTSADLYASPCGAVRDATLDAKLGLTAVDAKALFWATFVTSANATNAAARSTACLAPDATPAAGDGFKRYGLDLLPVPPDPDRGQGPDPSGAKKSGAQLSKLDYKKFTEAVAFDLRQPLGTGDTTTAKKALLANIFAGKVGFITAMDYAPFLTLDPSPVDQASIVEVFAAMPLKSGCYYRLADQKTRFFARVIGDDGKPSDVLWHLTATTTTDGVVSHTYVSDLEVRPAKSADFDAASDILANRPGCLDPKRAPE